MTLFAALLLAASMDAATEKSNTAALLEGPLNKDSIEAVVKAHLPELQRCYEIALETQKNSEGTVVLTWLITKEGIVDDLKIKSSTAKSPRVGACFRDSVRVWFFPRPADGRAQPVEYPFRLKLLR